MRTKAFLGGQLHPVMSNVRDIVNVKRSEFWPKGWSPWQNVVVWLLFDGIEPCDKDIMDVLATMGLYQHGVMNSGVNGDEAVARIVRFCPTLFEGKHGFQRSDWNK
jgi:chitin synthase